MTRTRKLSSCLRHETQSRPALPFRSCGPETRSRLGNESRPRRWKFALHFDGCGFALAWNHDAYRHFSAFSIQADRPRTQCSASIRRGGCRRFEAALGVDGPRRKRLAGAMSKGDGRELSSMMLSSQDFAATITKSDKGANSGHRLASTDAALGYFETPTATVHSCADPSQTPPALRVPSLATPVSPPVQAFEPDQSTAKKNSSFRTDSSPTSNSDTNITPKASFQHSARPIPILCTPRDPNRVITPLSGRGDRKGSDYFALAQSPSPRGRYFLTGSQQSHDGCGSESIRRRRRSSSSHLSRSLFVLKMHPDQLGNTRYTPTSPLSPRLPPAGRPVSPQPNRTRTAHRRQPSRNMQLNLGRFHPSNYQSNSQLAMESPASSAYGSGLTYQRMPQAESPRLMRERQRELIDRARLSSKIAASPMGIKPDRPTLAPLGSPKGNVTPLALEEGQEDYFQVGGAERVSPAQSPGAISNESTKEFGEELAKKTPKPEVFH